MKALVKRVLSPILQKASAIYFKKRRKYRYKDILVWVEPTVFPPFLTISTRLLLEFIENLDLEDKTVLELGCGCGIISILAAKKGATATATDINEIALNALANNAKDNAASVEILKSDLFENLQGRTFDCIVINPPYYPKNPVTIAENAWFCGENFEYFERLFHGLFSFASEKNDIYMILSEDCAIDKIKAIAQKNELSFALAFEKKVATETNYIFRITA